MGIVSKVYTTINNKILFDPEKKHPSVQAQKDYLYSFPEPQTVIERSYYKYKCLMFYSYSGSQKALINAMSFFALPVFLSFYRLKGLSSDSSFSGYEAQDKLLRKATKRIPITDIFPEKLCDEFAIVEDYEPLPYKDLYIEKRALKLLAKVIKQYPFRFHYHLVSLIRLAQASQLLHEHKPKAITTYVCEREFADPLLTEYYESYGVEYHGHMHGDYLYMIEQAFMHYSKYWVWGDHYEKLFKELRCDFETEIYTPGKNSGIVKPRPSVEDYDYYATYYFSNENKDSIAIIKSALQAMNEKGKKCKVRPHPRFSNNEEIARAFDGVAYIEDPKEISIEESLENSYLTIALASTVLSQAYHSGKKIVIDDISNPEKYRQLRERGYILIDKADYILSELI